MPEAAALLQAKSLTVYRGDDALFADIGFSVAEGDWLQIEGGNGSGKTTLLRVLCGLANADEGEVLWQGTRIQSQRSEFHADLLYLGHKTGIKAELSACENLCLYQHSNSSAGSETAIVEALGVLGLADRADLPCGVLSAGQQRRVALARLLLSPARLWILDEPLTALDVEGRDTVQGLLEKHVSAGGALVYTTHQALPINGIATRSLRLGL